MAETVEKQEEHKLIIPMHLVSEEVLEIQHRLTPEALALFNKAMNDFCEDSLVHASNLASARGSTVVELADIKKSIMEAGSLGVIVRVLDMCERTIKAGQLDGDCPAYDIRHICEKELSRHRQEEYAEANRAQALDIYIRAASADHD